MKDRREKTLTVRPADPQAKISRMFIVILIIQVTVIIGAFIAGIIWQGSLNGEHNARARTAACQFSYSVRLSRVLQARASLSERLRIEDATAVTVNAALNKLPYPRVPDCRR